MTAPLSPTGPPLQNPLEPHGQRPSGAQPRDNVPGRHRNDRTRLTQSIDQTSRRETEIIEKDKVKLPDISKAKQFKNEGWEMKSSSSENNPKPIIEEISCELNTAKKESLEMLEKEMDDKI